MAKLNIKKTDSIVNFETCLMLKFNLFKGLDNNETCFINRT